MTPAIVLLTDFGLEDNYVGLLKAVIASISSRTNVIDLTHQIQPQNRVHGAVMLEISYPFFPKGSIFVCVVDPGVGSKRRILCLKTSHYYFLAPDNGLLSLVGRRERFRTLRSVENKKFFRTRIPSSTFHGRDMMAPVGAHLARGGARVFRALGPVISEMQQVGVPTVKHRKGFLEGEILYFDHFGNAITNVKKNDASESFWEKSALEIRRYRLGHLRENYSGAKRKMTALFNSFDQLEIAVPGGSAQRFAHLKAGEKVKIGNF